MIYNEKIFLDSCERVGIDAKIKRERKPEITYDNTQISKEKERFFLESCERFNMYAKPRNVKNKIK